MYPTLNSSKEEQNKPHQINLCRILNLSAYKGSGLKIVSESGRGVY